LTTRIVNEDGRGSRINADRVGKPTEAEREAIYAEYFRLYGMGFSDLRMAEATETCDRTVRRWRYRHNLPNIYGAYPNRGE
jgi:hypothetical protein